ncbi:hypothetical protein [Sphingomonas pseudosanguinis]|uniref:Glycosyltransferase RgtA/B/C/D-like domain-containing protein n=1 Tax=Sphingomonas pseudosanguinis TaxID=413712 RepID=A0A7W6AF36_9SPHN|nr:hypothetical protein [Sphingomonas pseudosanguinis]MBB3881088.1 hypothetical protein [Sphingomonas pseudosanguinis]MBN3535343.1 hypothetical protein [Sphingomonas pseudosanguinis]
MMRTLSAVARSPLPSALLLLLVAVLLRAHDFGNPVIHVDEQYYLLVGDRMLHGAWPYLDLWDRKPVGLFALFAAMRMLPGDPILGYQLTATLFATATAFLIARGAVRLGATAEAALAGGVAYLIWLSLFSGGGGQSPVFYNLFTVGAALLTLHLPQWAARRDTRAILLSGAAACFLSGLAIQTKYTPVVEGAWFGLAHCWYARRAGVSWGVLILAALTWIILALLPTLAVMAVYWQRGPAVFEAFWFANFASVTLRKGYPAAKIAGRLAGSWSQLSPFVLCAVLALRTRPWRAELGLAFGWLAAALIAYAMIGAFFDHYALPVLAPLTMIAATMLGRRRWAIPLLLATGLILFATRVLTVPSDAAGARLVGRVVGVNSGHECPYVFAGDSVTYLLAGTCIPTARAFPSTLAYEPERGASGVDEVAEVRRILATRPPVIVTLDQPFATWNRATHALVEQAIARDYRLVLRVPREEGHSLVYLRRDRPFMR